MKKNLYTILAAVIILLSGNSVLAQEYNFRQTTYYYRGQNDTLISSGKNLNQFNFSNANRATDPLFHDGIYFPANDCFGRNLWIRLRHIAEDPNGTSVGINVAATASNPCQSDIMIGGWAGFLYDFEIHRDLFLTGSRGYFLDALYPTSITVASLETLSGSCGSSEWLSFVIVNPGSTGWSLNSINFTGYNKNSKPAFSDSLAVYTTGGCYPPDHFSYTFPSGSDSVSAINGNASGYTEFKMSAGTVSRFQYGYEYIGQAGGYQGMSMAFGSAPTFSISARDVSCKNGDDGQINVTINGGIGPFTYQWNNGAASGDSLTGLSSGTYLLTVTDQNGCGTIADTTVIINEPANMTVVLDSVLLSNVRCHDGSDGSIQLYATGAAPVSYAWSNGSTTSSISGLPAGIYVATITDLNSCFIKRDTISQPDAIDTSTSLNGQTITANETGASFQWINCNGNTVIADSINPSFTPSVTGYYKVAITKNGCSDTSSCVYVLINTGIEDVVSPAVLVYPNPCNDLVQLNFNKPLVNAGVKLINMMGQIVMDQAAVHGTMLTLDITGQLKGIYIMELLESGHVLRLKLLKN